MEWIRRLLNYKLTPMENLPNDIIMRIIREADGGLHTHKKKWEEVEANIWIIGLTLNEQGDDEFRRDGFYAEVIFRELFLLESLTNVVIKRRNGEI
jgi:hypothetical protein